MSSPPAKAWPALPYADWKPTKQTLHRYVQILGKVRMALVPFRNHWWHVTLYVTVRGLSTGPMPAGDGELEIRLDLIDHRLLVLHSDGRRHGFDLAARPAVADFHAQLFAALEAFGVAPRIDARPFDLGDGPAFADDRTHDAYDADAVWRCWRILALTQRAMSAFGGRFNGKASPVHVFWHSFDIAYARYSGRQAPLGDVDAVTAEAYSHEVIAFGFWPGDDRRTPYPAFYSYTAPEPDGLAAHALTVPGAEWQDTGSGSLAVLPYDDVRGSEDPPATVVAFYEEAYRAGAAAARWDADAFATRAGRRAGRKP